MPSLRNCQGRGRRTAEQGKACQVGIYRWRNRLNFSTQGATVYKACTHITRAGASSAHLLANFVHTQVQGLLLLSPVTT